MTIFSRIVAGEIPCYKIAETEKFFAFLDLSDEDLAGMQIFAKIIAGAIKRAFPCIKVGQAVLGLEVPHAHIHLIPMQSEKDMLFSNPKLKLTPEEFEEIASKIRAEIKL